MSTSTQYRAKAIEYGELVKTSTGSDEKNKFQALQGSFTELADNEQWLADNYQMTLHPRRRHDPMAPLSPTKRSTSCGASEPR